jgi:hypothetical protein
MILTLYFFSVRVTAIRFLLFLPNFFQVELFPDLVLPGKISTPFVNRFVAVREWLHCRLNAVLGRRFLLIDPLVKLPTLQQFFGP